MFRSSAGRFAYFPPYLLSQSQYFKRIHYQKICKTGLTGLEFLNAKGWYKKSPSSLLGKFLKNIAVFLKDMMGVLLFLWRSRSPGHSHPFTKDQVANSPGFYLVTKLLMTPSNLVFLTDLTSLMNAGRWTNSRMPVRFTRE